MSSSTMEKLDLFGAPISFIMNGSRTSRTKFGGLLSLIMGVICILLIIGFGQDFFKRINPSFVAETLNPLNYSLWNLTSDLFPFAFRYEDSGGNLLNDTTLFYFDINIALFQEDAEGNESTTIFPIGFEQCQRDKFFDSIAFDQGGLGQFYCPVFNNTIVGGYWDATFTYYIYVDINVCIEGSFNLQGEPCSALELVNNYFESNVYMSMMIPQIIVNPSDYNNPLQVALVNDYYYLDKYLMKQKYLYMQPYQITTDYGWILEINVDLTFLGFQRDDMDYQFLETYAGSSLSTNISTVFIYFDKKIAQYRREFAKVQSLAADVGGILKIFFFFGQILITFYNQCNIEFILINEHFADSNETSSNYNKYSLTNNNKLISQINLEEKKINIYNEYSESKSVRINNLVNASQNQSNQNFYSKKENYLNQFSNSQLDKNQIKESSPEVKKIEGEIKIKK